jgi:hypothetical protein
MRYQQCWERVTEVFFDEEAVRDYCDFVLQEKKVRPGQSERRKTHKL